MTDRSRSPLLEAHRFPRHGPVNAGGWSQLHAIIAWLFWASFPFSRLVHAWSIPSPYLGRPYILYRRRYSTAR